MADCERMQEMISAWIDGELPESERAELEAHLRTCETCAATERAFRGLSGALKETADEAPPENLTARVLAQIEFEERVKLRQEAGRHVSPWKSILAAAACFAVIASVGILAGPERLSRATPVGVTFVSQSDEGTGLVEQTAKLAGDSETLRSSEGATVLGMADAESPADAENDAAVTNGLTAENAADTLDAADSAAVLALLQDAAEPAEAPEGEPACTAAAKGDDGAEQPVPVWIVGDDLVFTKDGEHYLRAADKAEALQDILNHE